MVISPKYYLPGANIPKIFLDADKQINDANPEPETVDEPIEVPMPFIEGCPGAKGPIIVTKDWYVKAKKKKIAWAKENERDAQVEMMQLIADRDRLRYKLGKLDPSKKKDSKMIAAINVKLEDIRAELEALEMYAGKKIEEIDRGSRLGRFVGKLKRIFKKAKKKVKQWYERNSYVIDAVAAITLPVILSGIVKGIIGLITRIIG